MTSDFERLRAIVDADPRLQDELARHADSVQFVKQLIRLSIKYDLVLSEGAIWTAIEEGRQAWLATWSP